MVAASAILPAADSTSARTDRINNIAKKLSPVSVIAGWMALFGRYPVKGAVALGS